MKIRHKDSFPHEGSFIAYDSCKKIASLMYSYRGESVIDAYSTYVCPEYRGQAIAASLFDSLVEFAKEENLKIIATCSYIDIKFKKNKDLAYLLENKLPIR